MEKLRKGLVLLRKLFLEHDLRSSSRIRAGIIQDMCKSGFSTPFQGNDGSSMVGKKHADI